MSIKSISHLTSIIYTQACNLQLLPPQSKPKYTVDFGSSPSHSPWGCCQSATTQRGREWGWRREWEIERIWEGRGEVELPPPTSHPKSTSSSSPAIPSRRPAIPTQPLGGSPATGAQPWMDREEGECIQSLREREKKKERMGRVSCQSAAMGGCGI